MKTIEGIFRKLGKREAIDFLLEQVTDRVSHNKTISENCSIIWSYRLEEESLKRYNMIYGSEKYD